MTDVIPLGGDVGWPQRDKVNERVVLLKRIYRAGDQLMELPGSMTMASAEALWGSPRCSSGAGSTRGSGPARLVA